MFSVFGIGEEGGLIIFTKTGKSRIAKFLKKKGGLVEGGVYKINTLVSVFN